MKESISPFENRILAALPRLEYARFSSHLEAVRLPQGKTLYQVGGAIRYAYFLKSGMASLLSVMDDGAAVEVGMVGNEGLVGLPAILRINNSPYQVVVQLPGNALRLRADLLRAEFDRGGQLQDLLLRYLHTVLTQISQSAACNRFHALKARLCRWLLVSHDRAQTDTLHLTHEFLSQMIGAPRARVTMTASGLQKAKLIRYSRGKIQILDRRGLESSSCECYGIVTEEINHFMAA
jgi:CRP-like cAMP-binding protein